MDNAIAAGLLTLVLFVFSAIGYNLGKGDGHDAAYTEVHERLSARCVAPTVYSRDLLACVVEVER